MPLAFIPKEERNTLREKFLNRDGHLLDIRQDSKKMPLLPGVEGVEAGDARERRYGAPEFDIRSPETAIFGGCGLYGSRT